MKITWKIFLSTVLTMMTTFCLAGYFLISILFQSGYEQAVDGAVDVSQLFLYEFGNYMVGISKEENAGRYIGEVVSKLLAENVQVQIREEKGDVMYSNITLKTEPADMEVSSAAAVKRLIKQEEGCYIQIKSPVMAEDTVYHTVLFFDVTDLFVKREDELRIYHRFLILFLILDGVVSMILAGAIVRPIRKISRSTGRIARGDLEHRIQVRGQDEISSLARDFNRMADSLYGKIQELEDAARRQEEFIASFAHELKTPLTSIIGYADLLRSNRQTEEGQFTCANYIFQEGRRLENLSLRLLDLIVLEKKSLSLSRVNASNFLLEMREMLKPVMEEKEKKLLISAEDCELFIEPDLIYSVLINLVDNAAKTSAEVIALAGKCGADGYEIEVSDDGQGIPADELARITEAFYMVDKSRSRRQGGAGLGLAICQKIMELHGAKMRFESTVGAGTRVTLEFPACGLKERGGERK